MFACMCIVYMYMNMYTCMDICVFARKYIPYFSNSLYNTLALIVITETVREPLGDSFIISHLFPRENITAYFHSISFYKVPSGY